jgi:glutathione peroxidase
MNVYDKVVEKIDGNKIELKEYEGKVLLIVNTATGCGFTPQYDGLETLYKKYKDKGLEILDFPCNQFLNQAPGTNEEIASFCQVNFGISFQTFAKIEVNGDQAHPLYQYLKKELPEDIDNGKMEDLLKQLEGKFFVDKGEIQWNFTKFLIDKEGKPIKRFAPTVTPEELESHIEELL